MVMPPLSEIRDIVEALNQQSDACLGAQWARFEGHETYLSIRWGDILLWDSEGDFLLNRPYLEQADRDAELSPSLRACWLILHHEGAALAECAKNALENLPHPEEGA